jgi:hypothetical protein
MSLIYPDHPRFFATYPCFVKNGSGEEVPPCAVMRITSVDLVDGRIEYTIGKPDSTFRREYLVNSPIAIPSSSSAVGYGGRLNEGGYVYYNTGTPALGERWGATASQWYLTQHREGFEATGETTTFNSKNILVARGYVVQQVFGKCDAAISSGASGTVRVYGGATPGSESDTSLTVASCWNEGAALADEADVKVGWLHGKPYIEQFSGGSSTEIYRGVTDAAIAKGASGTVSRYDAAGVDTTTNDTVTNLFASVAISKTVIYVKIESTFFMIAAECPLT